MTEVRERITDRITRSRVELELRRSMRPLLILAGGVVLFALCVVFVARNLPGGGGLESTRTLRFTVADATGVVPGRAEARFKGIPAGKITHAEYDRGRAVLTVQLQTKRGPVYRDARAQLRPST
ncbi:MAG TPA: MlaD family protein, partial [Solirubrobacteraceae bacterium]